MAYEKSIELGNSGVFLNYWRLTHREDDIQNGAIGFIVHGYKDEEARRANKAPLLALRYVAAGEDIANIHATSTADLYELAARLTPQDQNSPVLAGAAAV